MAAALLALATLYLGWTVWRGNLWRPRVAALIGRGTPARLYLVWALSLFLGYALPALIGVALVGRSAAALPQEFAGLVEPGSLAAAPILAALAFGTILNFGIARHRARRGLRPTGIGNFPLPRPRDWREAAPAALLAVSAGVSEELFFRLLLPLLVAMVFGQPLLGFGLSALGFAVLHRYHGFAGAVSSGVGALVLSAIYLLSGALWLAMLLHAVVDLNGLVVRPAAGWGIAPRGD